MKILLRIKKILDDYYPSDPYMKVELIRQIINEYLTKQEK